MKTISELNSKAWYRFLKIIFFFVIGLAILYAIGGLIEDKNWSYLVYSGLFILIAFLVRSAFYYVVLGSFNPKK